MLRVLGDRFDASAFIENSTLVADSVFRKGEVRSGRSRPARTSGFNIEVGTGELPQQIEQVIEYVSINKHELKRLADATDVEEMFLDFQVDTGDRLAHNLVFPLSLLRSCSEVGLSISASVS